MMILKMILDKIDKRIVFSLFNFLVLLFLTTPVFAQGNLVVKSHIVNIFQIRQEEGGSRLDVREQIRIENIGPQIYQGQLFFWIGKTGRETTVVAIRDEEEREKKGSRVLLQSSTTEEGLVSTQLAEEVFIKPNAIRDVELLYTISPDENGRFLWQRKFFYNHLDGSLLVGINPIEQLGYKFEARGFVLSRSEEEEGWFVSEPISPKVGDIYSLSVGQSEVEPARQVQQEPQESPLVVIGEQVKKLIAENLLLVLLINNIFILSLVGLGLWRFKRKMKSR